MIGEDTGEDGGDAGAPDTERVRVCPYCDRATTVARVGGAHSQLDSNEPRYKCETCLERFDAPAYREPKRVVAARNGPSKTLVDLDKDTDIRALAAAAETATGDTDTRGRGG